MSFSSDYLLIVALEITQTNRVEMRFVLVHIIIIIILQKALSCRCKYPICENR